MASVASVVRICACTLILLSFVEDQGTWGGLGPGECGLRDGPVVICRGREAGHPGILGKSWDLAAVVCKAVGQIGAFLIILNSPNLSGGEIRS